MRKPILFALSAVAVAAVAFVLAIVFVNVHAADQTLPTVGQAARLHSAFAGWQPDLPG